MHPAVLLFTLVMCYGSNAYPEGMFKRGGPPGLFARMDFRKRMSPDEKCEKLSAAFQGVIDAVNKHPSDVATLREQILDTTGLDISDPEGAKKETCATAKIGTIDAMATQAGIPVETFREYYPSYVEAVQKVKAMLSDMLQTSEGVERELVSAALNFYKTIEDVGLLNLQ